MPVVEETLVRSLVVPVPPSEVFAVLADPTRHQDTEPGDWVREAIDPAPITHVGQIFGIHMYFEQAGGAYDMHNTVTTFERDRAIAWDPGQPDESGVVVPGGWRWQYDLAEVEGGTEVTLTYDWSAVDEGTRVHFGGFPVVSEEFLDASLQALRSTVR